jgi:hypothetical protein
LIPRDADRQDEIKPAQARIGLDLIAAGLALTCEGLRFMARDLPVLGDLTLRATVKRIAILDDLSMLCGDDLDLAETLGRALPRVRNLAPVPPFDAVEVEELFDLGVALSRAPLEFGPRRVEVTRELGGRNIEDAEAEGRTS